MVERFGLVPPVDLQLIAETCADVEYDAIPGRCDGLVIGLHGPRDRPLILLDDGTPHQRRQRFTFAHELGHVLLPWHLGDYLCDTTRWVSEERRHSAVAEVQANRFAAHLLVPDEWLADLVEREGVEQVLPLIEAIEDAEVSTPVACLRAITQLPPGFVFAIEDSTREVVLSGRSDGTKVPAPQRGAALVRDRLDGAAMEVEESRYGSRRVIWWSFRAEALPEKGDITDDRTAADVFAGLLQRHAGDEAEQMRNNLSGIIGYANGVARRAGTTSSGALYAFFRSRFASDRPLPDELVNDPDFDTWLLKRAEELGD